MTRQARALTHANRALRPPRTRRFPLWLGANRDERITNAGWLAVGIVVLLAAGAVVVTR